MTDFEIPCLMVDFVFLQQLALISQAEQLPLALSGFDALQTYSQLVILVQVCHMQHVLLLGLEIQQLGLQIQPLMLLLELEIQHLTLQMQPLVVVLRKSQYCVHIFGTFFTYSWYFLSSFQLVLDLYMAQFFWSSKLNFVIKRHNRVSSFLWPSVFTINRTHCLTITFNI